MLPGPDPHTRLCNGVYHSANRFLAQRRMDLICVSGPPFSLMTVGEILAAEHRTPLLLDFRDAWYTGMPWPYSSGLRRALARRWEKRCIAQAGTIITATDALQKILTQTHSVPEAKFYTARHGYELPPEQPPHGEEALADARDIFTLVHTGQLRGVDIGQYGGYSEALRPLSRGIRRMFLGARFCEQLQLDRMSGKTLLAAVGRAVALDPEFAKCIRLVFAGERSTQLDRWAAENGLADRLKQIGAITPVAAQQLACQADMLVLMLYGIEGCDYHWCVPSKTYSYLATGRPILALVPPGEARDLVTGAGTGLVPGDEQPDSIARTILHAFEAWQHGRAAVEPDWRFIEQFRADRQQSVFLDAVRKAICGGRPAVSSGVAKETGSLP